MPIVGLILIVGMGTATVAYAGPAIQENYMSQTETGKATASFEFSFDEAKSSVVMMHTGGDSFDAPNIYYQVNDGNLYTWNSLPAAAKNFGGDGTIDRGDYAVVGANRGDTIRVIAKDGGKGYILAEFNVPTSTSIVTSEPLVGGNQIATANFNFTFNSTKTNLAIQHNGGDNFKTNELTYQIDNGAQTLWSSAPTKNLGGDGEINQGDNINITANVGETVKIRVNTNGSDDGYVIGEYQVTGNTGGETGGNQTTTLPDDLTLSPSSHDFVVLESDEEDDKTFTLKNTGNETVKVSGISLSGGSSFSIDEVKVKSDGEEDEEDDSEVSSPYSFQLGKDQEAEVDVKFDSLTNEKKHDPLTQDATLEVTSSDVQNVSAELSGTDLPEKSGHIKAEADDGTVLANSKGNADGKDLEVDTNGAYGVTVSNEHGDEDLYVYEVEIDDADGEFTLSNPFDDPYHTIKAKDGAKTFSEQLVISYSEKQGEDHEADVTIKSTSNDHEDLEFTVKKADGDGGDGEGEGNGNGNNGNGNNGGGEED